MIECECCGEVIIEGEDPYAKVKFTNEDGSSEVVPVHLDCLDKVTTQ